jgi:hypothetical protein
MVVDPERLELPTPAFEAQCSIQLSYGSFVDKLKSAWTAVLGEPSSLLDYPRILQKLGNFQGASALKVQRCSSTDSGNARVKLKRRPVKRTAEVTVAEQE